MDFAPAFMRTGWSTIMRKLDCKYNFLGCTIVHSVCTAIIERAQMVQVSLGTAVPFAGFASIRSRA